MKALPGTMLVAAIALALLLAACSSDDDESSDGDTPGSPSPQPVSLDLTVEENEFSPATIEAELGAAIDIQMTNTGNFAHTFTLDEMFVDAEVAAGDEGEFTFIASEPGEFTFYCRYHVDQGMIGSLQVSRSGSASEPAATDSADSGGVGY